MQAAGNFLLFLSLLAVAYLFKLTFLQKMPGGDYGVGYAWATLFSMAAFWVCVTLVACIIGFGGGFTWLSLGRFASSGMLVLCFLVMLLGANLGLAGSFRGVQFLGLVSTVVTPLVLMAAFAVLLNENLKMAVPPTLVKWGLSTTLALNSLVLGTMILGMVLSNVGALLSGFNGKLDNFQLGMLETIDSCDTSKGIASLFIYSGDNQPRQIREKALLKIKSKPDWQEDLFKTLEGTYYVDDAFRFLLSNDVDDKPRFAKGVYQGVLSQAQMVRERLRSCSHPSHVYDGMFGNEVERSLEVVEKFKDLGVDFKPAVQELRAALDAQSAYGNLDISSKKVLDKWLKKH